MRRGLALLTAFLAAIFITGLGLREDSRSDTRSIGDIADRFVKSQPAHPLLMHSGCTSCGGNRSEPTLGSEHVSSAFAEPARYRITGRIPGFENRREDSSCSVTASFPHSGHLVAIVGEPLQQISATFTFGSSDLVLSSVDGTDSESLIVNEGPMSSQHPAPTLLVAIQELRLLLLRLEGRLAGPIIWGGIPGLSQVIWSTAKGKIILRAPDVDEAAGQYDDIEIFLDAAGRPRRLVRVLAAAGYAPVTARRILVWFDDEQKH